MRSFLPIFQLPTPDQAPQLRSKLGGVPWGLPAAHWPTCCERPQKLLAQLRHQPPMIDLGADGLVLHLFQCMECLNIGEDGASLLLHESQLEDKPTRVPGFDAPADLGQPLIGELWLQGWSETDDGIPAARLAEFFRESAFWKLQDEFPHIDWYEERHRTRFAGSPRWTGNGPQGAPTAPFEFVGQLDSFLTLPGPAPTPNQAGCTVTEFTEDADGKTTFLHHQPDPEHQRLNAPWGLTQQRGAPTFRVEYTNFGSDGTAYIFIDRTTTPPQTRWTWNR